MSTPIERLRKLHEQDCNCMCTCGECNLPETPCDLIAALDALEEGLHNLHARIDAATVLIRQAMEREHYSRHGGVSPSVSAPATCSACASYREWLGGEER